MSRPVITHFSASYDATASDAICGFEPENGVIFGMANEHNLVTCPDCILRLEGRA